MCKFLSVIVLRSGELLHHPMLDSHTDIQRYFRKQPHLAHALRDEDRLERFARVEFTPSEDTWLDPDKWTLKVDEDIKPGWWDETMENQTRKRLVHLVKTMILADGLHDFIIDGCWIVGGKATVRDARGGRLVTVRGSAKISDVGGSAQISNVRDSAQISNVWGSAQISNVRDSAQISNVGDSAQISDVWGSAKISDVWGSAQISNVRGSAQISNVGGSAKISDVGPSVSMDESAKIRVKGAAS